MLIDSNEWVLQRYLRKAEVCLPAFLDDVQISLYERKTIEKKVLHRRNRGLGQLGGQLSSGHAEYPHLKDNTNTYVGPYCAEG